MSNDPGSSISLAVSIVFVATLLLLTSGTTLMAVLYWQRRCCSTKSEKGTFIVYRVLYYSHYLAAGDSTVPSAGTTVPTDQENSNTTPNALDNPLYSSTEVPAGKLNVSFDNTYSEPWDSSAVSISLKSDYMIQTDVSSSATKTTPP